MEHDVIVPTPLLTYLHSSRRAFRFRRVLVALVISGLAEIKLEGEDGLDSSRLRAAAALALLVVRSRPGPPCDPPWWSSFSCPTSTAPSF